MSYIGCVSQYGLDKTQSKRLAEFINTHAGYNKVEDYYKFWQGKRYVEIIFTVDNWCINNRLD